MSSLKSDLSFDWLDSVFSLFPFRHPPQPPESIYGVLDSLSFWGFKNSLSIAFKLTYFIFVPISLPSWPLFSLSLSRPWLLAKERTWDFPVPCLNTPVLFFGKKKNHVFFSFIMVSIFFSYLFNILVPQPLQTILLSQVCDLVNFLFVTPAKPVLWWIISPCDL